MRAMTLDDNDKHALEIMPTYLSGERTLKKIAELSNISYNRVTRLSIYFIKNKMKGDIKEKIVSATFISHPAFDGVMTKCCSSGTWSTYRNGKRRVVCSICQKNKPTIVPYKKHTNE